MEELFQVGAITQTHGIKGEVKVFPLTDDVARFKKGVRLLMEEGAEELEIESVKFFKQYVILKFKGYNSINDIEKYVKRGLYVTRENAVKCEEDEYFIADLIGIHVFDEDGEQLGEIRDVLSTGANDVYVLEMKEGREVLLPAIKECILSVDIPTQKMTIHKMDGLF